MELSALERSSALSALEERKIANAKLTKVDNSSLHAGSPMYFYCKSCSALADVKPESYTDKPKKLCGECQVLKDKGLIQ